MGSDVSCELYWGILYSKRKKLRATPKEDKGDPDPEPDYKLLDRLYDEEIEENGSPEMVHVTSDGDYVVGHLAKLLGTYAGVAPLELNVQDYWEVTLRHFCRSHKLPWREPGWLYRVKASG